jgi:hypothetical protein
MRSMLALRALYAIAVTGLVVWALRSGQPFGALTVVVLGVALRRAVESGRLLRAPHVR